MINYEKVLKEFKKYLEKFDNNKSIAMKISHSYHVADLASKLAKRLELDEEEISLAKTIGLIHDIGRFVQYEDSGVFDDLKSNIDHANLAIDYLFLNNHIKDFDIPKEYHEIIKKAIFNHNKLDIAKNLDEKENFWAKFIRDVDKIDIFRQQSSAHEEWLYDLPLTNLVKKAFYNHELVNNEDIKTKSDEIIAELAFVFDINFKESYELLEDTDNLELFLSVIEVNRELESDFDVIKKEVRTYLNSKLN